MLHLSLDGEGGGALGDSPLLPQVLYLKYNYSTTGSDQPNFEQIKGFASHNKSLDP